MLLNRLSPDSQEVTCIINVNEFTQDEKKEVLMQSSEVEPNRGFQARGSRIVKGCPKN